MVESSWKTQTKNMEGNCMDQSRSLYVNSCSDSLENSHLSLNTKKGYPVLTGIQSDLNKFSPQSVTYLF